MNVRALRLCLAAICLTAWGGAAGAEPVPFSRILDVAEQALDTIFFDALGFYFVLDPQQNIAWIVDEDGKFQQVVSLTEKDGNVNVSLNDELIMQFPQNEPVEWQTLAGVSLELPETRRVFQSIPEATLTKALGKFLTAGSQFDGYFSVQTPEGGIFSWRPAGAADGIYVQDLTTGSMDFVEISTLADALVAKE